MADELKLPFTYRYEPDGRLAMKAGDEYYPLEFGSWGAHSGRHAGAHLEGNNKSNFRVPIVPTKVLKEISGNGNGICDSSEVCGLTAADAFTYSPWYEAQNDDLKLISIEGSTGDLSPWVPGEKHKTVVIFSMPGFSLRLQHVGEISPELKRLVEKSGQSVDVSDGRKIELKPVAIPRGIRLARPQVQGKAFRVGTQDLYEATAQVEWSIEPDQNDKSAIKCQWQYFSQQDRTALQASMDRTFAAPQVHSMWQSDSKIPGEVDFEATAEATLCASDSIAFDNYKQLSSNNSFGWADNLNKNAQQDVFVVYPIHKESATYKANTTRYANSDISFLFERAHDGSSDSPNYQFSMMQAGKRFDLTQLSGQVIGMRAADDTPTHDTFVVRITSARSKNGDPTSWGHREFVLQDPDGYKLGFFSKK